MTTTATTERFTAWLLQHPKLRRALILMASVHVLCLWAVVAAPHAAAATGAAALGWTGLHDTDGVPLKDYFLSGVDTPEAISNNGQHLSLTDPSTWVSWMGDATQTAITHATAAWWLTNEAAALVFLIGLALWFLRFAMSSSWLVALAQVGRPVFAAVNTLVNQMWLGPLAITVCACVAGFHYMHGRPARAWNLVGTAAILTALSWTVFKDPIDDLVSDHGLLGIGRATGFQIAQAARNGSYTPGQSLEAQLDALLAQLVSATARPALQLQNFGMVVDDIGSCGRAWSQAVMAANGRGPGPAHAMARCGAPQALAHAQQLGANDFILGLFFIAMGFLVALFVWYVGISTLLVGAKATFYAIVVGPAILLGMTGWQRAKNYAIRAGSQLGLHAVEMIIFTTFLAITSVGMGWALTTTAFGHGGSMVVPRLLLVGLGSIVAIFVFHYIDKHFYTDSLGTIAHHVHGAWHSTRYAARAEYDDLRDNLDKARRARDRYRDWRGRSARDDDNDDDAANAVDDSTPGFDVVKPRPGRRPGDTAAQTAAGRTASTASEVAEVAIRGGAAAEAAVSVAAPEVAIPAAAVIATAHHLRKRHHSETGSTPDDSTSTAAHDGPDKDRAHTGQTTGPSSDDDTSDANLSLPTVSPRPASGSGRYATAPPSDAAVINNPRDSDYGVEPSGWDVPPIEQPASIDEPSHAALEFPSTPPRRTSTRKGE
ncbi:MAG: hypothetical protein ACRDTK_00735 [Mycobacterium sp.]